MPKEGSNIKKTSTGRWSARFKIRIVTLVDGAEHSNWKDKERTFDTKVDAENFLREVRLAASRGEVWTDKRDIAIVTMRSLGDAYVAAASSAPESTQRHRKSMIGSWLEWAGEERAVTELSASLLERYAASLPSEGRKASTRHRKVQIVEQMWLWARRRRDLFPGVPEAEQITGNDADSVKPPPPVVRTAAPSWADLDKMILALRKGRRHEWRHRRLALLLRYTGLRVSQALGLRWDDLHLDHETPYALIRAGRRGAKGSKGRVIPLHPALVELLRTWPREEDSVVGGGREYLDGSLVRHAFYVAWEDSGVEREKWDASEAEKAAGERAFGSPCHSFRAAVKVGLLRAEVGEALADYLLGHATNATVGAYVPESSPEASPLWPQLVRAIRTIPRHRFHLEVEPEEEERGGE